MTDLSTLRSLQQRIREATGPDRELDFAICKVFGRAPQDAIWEVDENLPPEFAKHYKRGWTTPAYVKHRLEYKRGIDAAFAKECSEAERAAEIKALDREWDYKSHPPFGNVPSLTSDPDGLGACVELMRSLLPDAHWEISRTALRPGMIPGGSPHEYRADVGDWGTPCRKWHDRAPHALLLAICAALIAEEEAREKADADTR